MSFVSNGQEDSPFLSINYASHAQQAYNTKAKKMYRGRYSAARNEYIADLKEFIITDNVIDVKDISRLKDNRPRYIKLLEKVDLQSFKEEQFLPYIENINAMGIYYHSLGQYRVADFLFTKCLKIQGDHFGKTNDFYVAILHNIANLRKDQGRFDASEDIFNYVLRYYENVSSEKSRNYVIALNNRAMLLANLGRTNDAVKDLEHAIDLHNQLATEEESIDGERIQVNRALIALEENDLNLAESLLLNIKVKLEAKGFENHPDYSDLIVFLGSIYLNRGTASAFMPALENAIEKIESAYGNSHPYYANVLELQSEYLLLEGNFLQAEILLKKIVSIRLEMLGDRHPQYLKALSKLALTESYIGNPTLALQFFTKSTDTYLYLTSLFFSNMTEVEKAKFWKTFESDIQLFYEFAIANANLPGVTEAVANLQLNTKGMLLNNNIRLRQQLSNSDDSFIRNKFLSWQTAKNELAGYYALSKDDLNEEGIDIAQKEKEVDDFEKELAQKSSDFTRTMPSKNRSWEDIQNKLLANEAAIEIIKVNASYGSEKGKKYYIGIITKKTGLPKMVILNNGNELEGKYYSFYQNAIKLKIEDNSSYTQYWSPFENYLESIDRVYVCPDGIYNSISLSALREDTKYLLDEINVVIVTSLNSLTKKEQNYTNNNNKSMLIGNPAFGSESTIAQLPGAEIEVKEINALLSSQNIESEVYIGEKATESIIKECSSPEVLHIATHGFFLEDLDTKSGISGIQISYTKDNPLLRSGLLLKGAADKQYQNGTFDNKDNGVLTAYEVMNMNLENTKLVVLSACETGLGEVVNGEGVYGLSRSLRIAGSEAVMMSLWKVDDQSTLLLMTSFYKLWLETDEIESSFIAAQKAVREVYPDPYYWGAFILMGG